MTHQKLIKILAMIRPGAQWVLRGETLADLEWLDQVQIAPTQDDIDAGEAQVDAVAYKDLRAPAYPPIGDGLDALVHKENGDATLWDAYVDACNAVKAQFPKPE